MAKVYVAFPPAGGSSVLTNSIYPNADGGYVIIPWSGDTVPTQGGWETTAANGTSSAGYAFTNFDTVINNQISYGASKVIVVLAPITFGGKNKSTPNYVFTAGWASSQSVTQLFTGNGSGYAGAGTIPFGTCAQGVDNTAFPVVFQPVFQNAWEAAINAALGHMKAASYASKIAYVRIGGSAGGEVQPFAPEAMQTQVTPQTIGQLQTTWVNYVNALELNINAQSSGFSFDQGVAGGLGTSIPNISYQWADQEAANAFANGFGIGNQGLRQKDISLFSTHGTTSGNTATSGFPGNDFCFLFNHYPSAAHLQLQTVSASDPTGSNPNNLTGSLVTLIPFAIQRGCTDLELYYQDWQIAYDTSNQYYAQYGAAYRAAIQSARSGPVVNPLGTVTGFFQNPSGTPVNGSAFFKLSQDAQNTNACYAPAPVSFPVIAGTLTASVVFNDVLLTSSGTVTSYQIRIIDSNGAHIFGGKYQLVGGTANLNTLVPM